MSITEDDLTAGERRAGYGWRVAGWFVRRREASMRYRRHVQDLLDRRADLQGVSKLADLISDATRWAA